MFSEENQQVSMKRESQLLSHVRRFPIFFHDYRDGGVTGDPSGNYRMLAGDLNYGRRFVNSI
jgi:hypothetical protein